MAIPTSPYIEERYGGGLFIAGTRVGLDVIATRFKEGASPERIAECFPTVKLAQVYGAIAYYLENRDLLDEYFTEAERELHRLAPPLSQLDPELFARLEAARREMAPKRT